jgi:hypothetical protein
MVDYRFVSLARLPFQALSRRRPSLFVLQIVTSIFKTLPIAACAGQTDDE